MAGLPSQLLFDVSVRCLGSHGCEEAVEVAIVEHLRVHVPAGAQEAWLDAERRSWEPWLERQNGFLGRDLLWDPLREEGILLIHWSSREQWLAIPSEEIARVQERFESLARESLQGHGSTANPFPLIFSGEAPPASPLSRAGA